MDAYHHHVVVGRGDAFSALQRNLNEVNHGRLMICHEDDRLRGNCSVLVSRQDVVTALDLLDRSGFTRRILALDDLHERARDEAVSIKFGIVTDFIHFLTNFFRLVHSFDTIVSPFLVLFFIFRCLWAFLF